MQKFDLLCRSFNILVERQDINYFTYCLLLRLFYLSSAQRPAVEIPSILHHLCKSSQLMNAIHSIRMM